MACVEIMIFTIIYLLFYLFLVDKLSSVETIYFKMVKIMDTCKKFICHRDMNVKIFNIQGVTCFLIISEITCFE